MTKWERRFIVYMCLGAAETDLKSAVKDGGEYEEIRRLTKTVILLRIEAQELGIKLYHLPSNWVEGAINAYQEDNLYSWIDTV